ncbi:xanthine dehydrogenase family protein molybdopterin-binding subunit [Psychromarinibacter halotolerans]|uniref:Xanthine dehydrogenase family protein molybdopterin-binding subunit n=1 Tax=Psychromarinibacter halotolerans TaxID=1775175 RepID=A0ABV7GSX8_9RHOB|nr:xanthine dehydrogenase family protein molybdopterin-binding subunit [Psychromarinibacter halotolerans]MDF0597035.1 xanthine dehydrogenase family protein molybdopterin-binding subunit [Psychromarinibacter halotolerans]
MEKFGKSQSVKRVEDLRLLTGHGRYVEDIAPEGSLVAYFVRSTVAHAVIKGIDTAEAKDVDGVHAVLTAQDLIDAGVDMNIEFSQVPNRDGSEGCAAPRPVLATDRVRYVGEAYACVIAETMAQAKDAAELIEFDYDELPAKIDPVPGGEELHPDHTKDNIVYDFCDGDEAATKKVFEEAHKVIELEVVDNRIIVNSMEPRGAYAEWDGDKLHLCFNGQGVWGMKSHLAKSFGMDEEKVRVTHPDVGGGFGMKAPPYPEYFVIAEASKRAGKPVLWMSDRTEAMLTDNGGRALVSTTKMAFDADNKLIGYWVQTMSDMGAYSSNFGQFIQSFLFARVLMGVYDVQHALLEVKGIFTNTVPTDAYRGAGRPEAIFALERSMDNAARVLGVDPLELRRKNFIPVDKFPYKTVTGENYDVGDFNKVLNRAEAEADLAGFAARKAKSAEAGKLRGLGLCYYIESILGDPSEHTQVDFNEDGTATIYVGTQSNGQGHETVFAQFLSDQTGIPVDKISFVQGDSDRIAIGGGTGGSRSVTTQNNAVLYTVEVMTKAFTKFLAEENGVDESDVSFDDERFRIEGSNATPSFLEVAAMAREKNRTDLLSFREKAKIPGRSYPNGAHFAEVEIDPDTGETTVVKYTVVDDLGNLINPMLAEGQVHGGVAQGIGQAINERVVYDEDGQLLTATFMDYSMPRAYDTPWIMFNSEPVPSTANIMGMKGCGEAGTVGALAAVTNAVQDAVWDRGIQNVAMPFTPMRVWELLNAA